MLFKKVATLTDVHYGRSGNSIQANQDNDEFIDWFIEEARTWGADAVICMGDWHDRRDSINISTMDYSLRAMKKLNDSFPVVYWIPGNHDLYYRDKRDVSSIAFGQFLPNIKIIGEPTTINDVTILPWLIGDEHKKLKNLKSRYVFGHLELGGFMMNARVEMPEHENGIKSNMFKNQEYVFSGHFHLRQQKNNVVYTGNIFPFNFSDNWDEDRGMMFLEWGKDPVFKAWPGQPLFRTLKLSDMLSKPDFYLRPKMTIRAALDMEITYEEAQIIRDEFIKSHQLRKIELIPATKQEANQEFSENITFQSVDQIIIDGLLSVQSLGLKPEKLVEIYKSLPNM